jgi:hypothetical protein
MAAVSSGEACLLFFDDRALRGAGIVVRCVEAWDLYSIELKKMKIMKIVFFSVRQLSTTAVCVSCLRQLPMVSDGDKLKKMN